jgi:hypothetical protein
MNLTLENLISLIREFHRIPNKTEISENTLLEDGLGITGDDGCELLEEIEKTFSLSFTGKDGSLREAFDLEENQFLFHGEGIDLFGIFSFIFGRKPENVKPITVGDLLTASLKVKNKVANG